MMMLHSLHWPVKFAWIRQADWNTYLKEESKHCQSIIFVYCIAQVAILLIKVNEMNLQHKFLCVKSVEPKTAKVDYFCLLSLLTILITEFFHWFTSTNWNYVNTIHILTSWPTCSLKQTADELHPQTRELSWYITKHYFTNFDNSLRFQVSPDELTCLNWTWKWLMCFK